MGSVTLEKEEVKTSSISIEDMEDALKCIDSVLKRKSLRDKSDWLVACKDIEAEPDSHPYHKALCNAITTRLSDIEFENRMK